MGLNPASQAARAVERFSDCIAKALTLIVALSAALTLASVLTENLVKVLRGLSAAEASILTPCLRHCAVNWQNSTRKSPESKLSTVQNVRAMSTSLWHRWKQQRISSATPRHTLLKKVSPSPPPATGTTGDH